MKLRITVEGKAYEVDVEVLDDGGAMPAGPAAPVAAPTAAPVAAAPAAAPVPPPAQAPAPQAGAGDQKEVTSPMAGNVVSLRVKAGDTVAVGDTLLVLEAMKMESNVASPTAGTVSEVLTKEGEAVSFGQVMIRFS